MLRIYDDAVIKSLPIYTNIVLKILYTRYMEKSNIFPVHKKGDKQIVNNYRPASLLF